MRRQGQQYADSVGNAYVGAQMQHVSGQTMDTMPDYFQGRLEAFTPERDRPYTASKPEEQWRWERDQSKVSAPVVPQMFNEGQEVDASRSYFQGKRAEPNRGVEDGNNDPRYQPRGGNMQVSYEDKPPLQSFEGLEQKFFDDIIKLAKEQHVAEDAESARHKEKVTAINDQYQEKLVSLRARYAGIRDEFLRKESLARKTQYQQAVMNRYPASDTGPGDIHGYSSGAGSGSIIEARRAYNSNNAETFGEQARFHGSSRDAGFESRGPYPGGRFYDTGSRY